MVMWEILNFAALPYGWLSNEVLNIYPFKFFFKEVFEQVPKKQVTLKQSENCPDSLYSIICKCWEIYPNERINFLEV